MLAEGEMAVGQTARAAALAERARGLSQEEMIAFGAGSVFAAAGDEKRRAGAGRRARARARRRAQMYAALVRGEVERHRHNLREAIGHFREGLRTTDSWLARFALGRAYVEADAFTEAHAELEACAKRRGEATDVFLDAVPTYRLYAPVQYYLGRAHEGLKSPEAASATKAFLGIKARADVGDRLVEDARRRLAGR